MGILYKFTSPEHPRARRHEGRAELQQHVSEIKQVGDSTKEGDNNADALINLHASGTADEHQVEIERIQEKRHEAGDKKDSVPFEDGIASRIKNTARPVPLFAEEMRSPITSLPEREEFRRRRVKAATEGARLPCAWKEGRGEGHDRQIRRTIRSRSSF